MFAVTNIEPRIPIILLGVAFSLVPAAMWPAVAKIVRESKLGTAYGFMFTVQNLGMFAFPIIIGMVVDASNPYYRTKIDTSQFQMVQEQDMKFSGKFMDRRDDPIKNSEILLTTVVFRDSISGDIIWRESHQVKTDEKGIYQIEIGKGDVLINADFSQIVDTIDYRAKVSVFDGDDVVKVYDNKLSYDENLHFISDMGNEHKEYFSGRHRGSLVVYDDDTGQKVWEETIRFYVDDKGEFDILLGYGRIVYANRDYFGINFREHEAEIIKPLDYTNPMLVFAALGFFGLIFAFLLKREDKTSGYGLELPNRDME